MRPLDRTESFRTIAHMFESANEIMVAAPYFGDGAAHQLGLSGTTGSITVVCDLFSGGCNPKEIRRIARLPSKPMVMRLAGLHAKIYLTESAVVIGSANPSSNGLGFEGKELAGNVEACVFSSDADMVAAWRDFFKEKVEARATNITPGDIQKAMPLFDQRRKGRRRGETRTLLEEMRTNRDSLRDRPIFFTLYTRVDPSPEEDKVIDERNAALGTTDISAYFAWNYIPPPGSFIIDFITEEGPVRIKCQGIWRVMETDHLVRLKEGDAFFVYHASDILGLRLPRADQAYFCRLLEGRYSANPDFLETAYDVARLVT